MITILNSSNQNSTLFSSRNKRHDTLGSLLILQGNELFLSSRLKAGNKITGNIKVQYQNSLMHTAIVHINIYHMYTLNVNTVQYVNAWLKKSHWAVCGFQTNHNHCNFWLFKAFVSFAFWHEKLFSHLNIQGFTQDNSTCQFRLRSSIIRY